MPSISLSQLQKDMKELELKTQHLEPILKEIANATKNTSELSFEHEQSPFKEKWKPLSQKTLKRKKGSKILTESAMLQSSINTSTREHKSTAKVSIGSNLKYAALHQFGGTTKKGVHIPARPYLPVNNKGEIPKELLEEIKDLINSFVIKK